MLRFSLDTLTDPIPEKKEEVLAEYHGDPHPLNDEDYLYDIENHLDQVSDGVDKLKQELQYVKQATKLITRTRNLIAMLRHFGGHTVDCEWIKIVAPKPGEESDKCTCRWYEISSKMRWKRYNYRYY